MRDLTRDQLVEIIARIQQEGLNSGPEGIADAILNHSTADDAEFKRVEAIVMREWTTNQRKPVRFILGQKFYLRLKRAAHGGCIDHQNGRMFNAPSTVHGPHFYNSAIQWEPKDGLPTETSLRDPNEPFDPMEVALDPEGSSSEDATA